MLLEWIATDDQARVYAVAICALNNVDDASNLLADLVLVAIDSQREKVSE